MSQSVTIPKGYEKTNAKFLELHNKDKGVIIGISEINKSQFNYLVTKTMNQKAEYQGVFEHLDNAENKVLDLAE